MLHSTNQSIPIHLAQQNVSNLTQMKCNQFTQGLNAIGYIHVRLEIS